MDVHGRTGSSCELEARKWVRWWYMMVHDGTWWYMMAHDGTWWYMMVHDGTWWYMMVYDGTWWYMMVHDGTWWYMMAHEQTEGRICEIWGFRSSIVEISLFRVAAQSSLICCRRFRKSCRFHLKQLRRPRRHLNPWSWDRHNGPKRRYKPAYAAQRPTRTKILDEQSYW